MSILDLMWLTALVLLALSAIFTVLRMILGPGSLDRLVAADTTAGVVQCSVAVYVAWTLDSTVVPAIIVLTLLGFLGATSIARFRVADARRHPVPALPVIDATAGVEAAKRAKAREEIGGPE